MKAIKFKESDYYSVELYRGKYVVDDKLVDIDQYSAKIQVLDVHNICSMFVNKVIAYYLKNGTEEVSVESYVEAENKLLSKRIQVESNYRDDEPTYKWQSLEDEFEYRKFKEIHSAIHKEITLKGEPYLVEIVESVIDTGNKYISSEYINGGNDPIMFIYNREVACLDIVANKFKELGMEFKGNVGYEQTKNNKIWGNSTHSGIKYVTAFNTYPFKSEYSGKTRGKLDYLTSCYNADKEQIESIIQKGYNEHFKKFDSILFNNELMLSELRAVNNMIRDITDNKVNTKLKLSIHKKINTAIETILSAYAD